VVVEAKGSDGSAKSAIGQAAWYGECMSMNAYILLPIGLITKTAVNVAKRANVGIITTRPTSLNFSVVHNVGGFETFHPSHYSPNIHSNEESGESVGYKETSVGGVDKEINQINATERTRATDCITRANARNGAPRS